MSAQSARASVIRVALTVLNSEGWSTESGKNASGFVLAKNGERLLLVGHGRWDVHADERDQLYGRLLRLYSRHPDAARGVVVLPLSSRDYMDEISREVRYAIGVEIALVDPAAETVQWFGSSMRPEFVDLDGNRSSSVNGSGVVSRLRRLFS